MLYPPNEAQNASKVDGYKSIYAIIWPDKCAQLCHMGYGVWNSNPQWLALVLKVR